MSAEVLAGAAGVILSLFFSYVPKVKPWWEGLDGEYKRLIQLGLMALTSLAIFGFACAGYAADLGVDVTCDQAGAWGLVRVFVTAMVANQGTYLLSPGVKRD